MSFGTSGRHRAGIEQDGLPVSGNRSRTKPLHFSRTGVLASVVVLAFGAIGWLALASHAPLAALKWADETPSWSPNGREIVFASNRANPKSGIDELYLMKADGSGVKRLTEGKRDAREPSFSPDGKRIAYAANVDTSSGLFTDAGGIGVVSAHGGAVDLLTTGLRGDSEYPSWSPDGRWIAFINDTNPMNPNAPSYLSVVRPDGSGLRRLAINAGELAWSPNGKEIAFDGVGGVDRVGVDDPRPTRVVRSAGVVTDLAWSPDGSDIAYVSGEEGGGAVPVIVRRYLWDFNLRSHQRRPLRPVIDSDSVDTFGVTITWLRARAPRLAVFDGKRTDLLAADGHRLGALTTKRAGTLSAGSASPDGKMLLFFDGPTDRPSTDNFRSAIFAASVDDQHIRQLTQG